MNLSGIEINELKEDKKAGRTYIKMTATTIHERGQWNKRGMTWLEEYVNDNIESLIGAPFVVSWAIDKEIPSDHGTLSYDEDGKCVFYDSDTVGSIQKAYVEELEIDGRKGKKLVCEGYLYEQRYPLFVKWLKEQIKDNEHIKGSVEVNGKGGAKEIIYESGNGHNPDGTWEIGRIPRIFDFSALAILYMIPPADDGSEIVEINSLQKQLSTENNKTTVDTVAVNSVDIDNDKNENNNNKEDFIMTEQEINALKEQLAEKEKELNACKEELNALKDKVEKTEANVTEINSLLVEANKLVESQTNQIAELNSELEPLRQMEEQIKQDKAQAEVNAYFEKIKEEDGFSEAEINSLSEEFVEKCDLEGLKAKETELAMKKFREMMQLNKANTEINSVSDSNLFFSTKVEVNETVEANSTIEDGADLFK